VKADLEHELEDFSLNCSKCGLDVAFGFSCSAYRQPVNV
jgi:hypothetical protein